MHELGETGKKYYLKPENHLANTGSYCREATRRTPKKTRAEATNLASARVVLQEGLTGPPLYGFGVGVAVGCSAAGL